MIKYAKIALAIILWSILHASFAQSEFEFTGVKLDGVGKVRIVQADSNAVTATGVKDYKPNVKNSILIIDSEPSQEFHVKMKKTEKLIVSGSGSIISENQLVSPSLSLDISGSGKIIAGLQTDSLFVNIGGSGKVELSGSAGYSDINISGAGKVEAFDLATSHARVDISGLGKCNIDVRDNLVSNISGMGAVNYKSKPANLTSEISGDGKISEQSNPGEYGDTTTLKMGSMRVLILQNDSIKKSKKEAGLKSKPVFAGLEIGFNNLMNTSNALEVPSTYDFLELNSGKSVFVSLNFFQKNFRFGKSNFWFTTGLGVNMSNFRFDKNVVVDGESSVISGFHDTQSSRSYEKSKLTVSYLQAPLMLNVFTSKKNKNAFHIGAGAMVAYKIGSHTKLKYSEDGETIKLKSRNDFHLNPLRYGVRANIGYRKLNVFAEYYASTLFKEKEGPALYPVNVGVTLVGF